LYDKVTNALFYNANPNGIPFLFGNDK